MIRNKKVRTLNLDGMFMPIVLPEIEFDKMVFSGGEQHIKLNNNIDYSQIDSVVITHRVRSTDDLMQVLIAKDALSIKGIKHFVLVMPYIPYARQDRKCFEGESFTLKVFTDVLNSAKFDTVYVLDSHSDVAPALINNCVNIDNTRFVGSVLKSLDFLPVLISPDAGSNKKANKLSIHFELDLVKCDKIRDTQTGNLSGFEVFSNDLKGRNCIIVDDICDGGGTFVGLTEELKKKNAGDVYLFVTHGIFSKGFDVFKNTLKHIYCTNSFSDITNEFVTQQRFII